MWKWIELRELIARHVTTSDTPTAERHVSRAPARAAQDFRASTRRSTSTLANRHADSVVLTFGQLEDLLGFPLPDSSRVQQEWWTGTDRDAGKSSCSDAWILAGRTAKPNLLARTVAFERRIESRRDSRAVK